MQSTNQDQCKTSLFTLATPITSVKPSASFNQTQKLNVSQSRYSAMRPVVMKMSKGDEFVPLQNGTKFTQQFRSENPQKIFRSNSSDALKTQTAFKSTKIQQIVNAEAPANQNMSMKQNKVPANNLHVPKFNLNGNVPKMQDFFQNLQGVKFMSKNKNGLSNKIAQNQSTESFTVNQMGKADQKVGANFMDKSIDYSPEAIMAAMTEFYENILNNPQLKDLKM